MLFYRDTSPSEIDRMEYFDLRYWASLTEIEIEAKKKIADKLGKN